jgi:hypothetical protein
MPKKGKTCLLKNYYMLTLTYGAETCMSTKANIGRLMVAEMCCIELRIRRQKIRTEEIIENL